MEIFLQIFDGMVSIGKLRGKIQKDLSLVTQTNMLRIQFNSDDSNEKRGFHFSYTQGNTILYLGHEFLT